MPSAPESTSGSTEMILGELRGQMREMIHSVNNLGVKVDGLYREVRTLTILATDVADLKVRLKEVEIWAQRRDDLPAFAKESSWLRA